VNSKDGFLPKQSTLTRRASASPASGRGVNCKQPHGTKFTVAVAPCVAAFGSTTSGW